MEERIKRLEEQTLPTLYEIKAKVNLIEKSITESVWNGKDLIKHNQQILSLEARVKILDQKQDEMRKEIASINLKIALASGAYWVIIFILNKFL